MSSSEFCMLKALGICLIFFTCFSKCVAILYLGLFFSVDYWSNLFLFLFC
jgi:hypothetical protein